MKIDDPYLDIDPQEKARLQEWYKANILKPSKPEEGCVVSVIQLNMPESYVEKLLEQLDEELLQSIFLPKNLLNNDATN